MPQDPLTQLLTQKAMMQNQPQVPLPETTPESGSLGNRVMDGGMDFLLSALGVRGQKPGDVATGLGSLVGAGLPFLGNLKGLKPAVETSRELSPLLQEIFANNPNAEAAYKAAMAAQKGDILAQDAKAASQAREIPGANVAKYGRADAGHDALLDLKVADRPRPIPTETGFATAIPIGNEPQWKAQITGGAGRASNLAANTAIRMEKSSLTPSMVQQIRSMKQLDAIKEFPDIPEQTIRGIIRGDIYNNVK